MRRLSIYLQTNKKKKNNPKKTQTNSTNTKPTRSTSIVICHSDAQNGKQPVTEPSISWTQHIFVIIMKMWIDGQWIHFRVTESSTAHTFVKGKRQFLKVVIQGTITMVRGLNWQRKHSDDVDTGCKFGRYHRSCTRGERKQNYLKLSCYCSKCLTVSSPPWMAFLLLGSLLRKKIRKM